MLALIKNNCVLQHSLHDPSARCVSDSGQSKQTGRSPSEHCGGTSWTDDQSVFRVLSQFCLQIHSRMGPSRKLYFILHLLFTNSVSLLRHLHYHNYRFSLQSFVFSIFSFYFQKAVTSNHRTECMGTLHLLTFHYFQKIRKGQTVAKEKWFLFLFIDLRDNCRNGNCIIYRSHHSNVSQNWSFKKPLHVKA